MADGDDLAIEVERKLDVPDGWTVPDLAGAGAVVRNGRRERQELRAVYFDTPDHRLAAAGLLLRRRAGGPDEGWHLKMVTRDDDERVERHEPLDAAPADTPPAPLTDLVFLTLRGQAVQPVATIDTTRWVTPARDAAGGRLVDVVDDQVTADGPAGPMSWREIEVELVDGAVADLAAVVDALVESGATPSESSAKLLRVLAIPPPCVRDQTTLLDAVQEHVDSLVLHDPLARANAPDAVHQLRVAARRLRSIFASFRRHLDTELATQLAEELRWLGLVLSPVRDAEVLIERLDRAFADLGALDPDAVAGARQLVMDELERRFGEARAAAEAEMRSDRYLALIDRLRLVVADGSLLGPDHEPPSRKALSRDLARARRRLDRRVDEVEDATGRAARHTALHDVRKAAKRLRYAAETLRPVLGDPAKGVVKKMKPFQEVLGEALDAANAVHLIEDVVGAVEDPAVAFVLGHVHGLQLAESEQDYEEAGADLGVDLDDEST